MLWEAWGVRVRQIFAAFLCAGSLTQFGAISRLFRTSGHVVISHALRATRVALRLLLVLDGLEHGHVDVLLGGLHDRAVLAHNLTVIDRCSVL